MFARLGALGYAYRSKSKKDMLEDQYSAEEMKILKTKGEFYTFTNYPINLWLFASITLSIAIYLTYFLIKVALEGENMYLVNFATLILYLVSFFTFYAGKIETVYIDKKKGIIRHKLLNCFLSKIEYVKPIDNIRKIEMIKRGRISYSSDTSRYFVRIRFKDKARMTFGETLSYLQVQRKYRICLALLKGEVIDRIAKKSMLIDETIDERTLFNEEDNANEVDYTKED